MRPALSSHSSSRDSPLRNWRRQWQTPSAERSASPFPAAPLFHCGEAEFVPRLLRILSVQPFVLGSGEAIAVVPGWVPVWLHRRAVCPAAPPTWKP